MCKLFVSAGLELEVDRHDTARVGVSDDLDKNDNLMTPNDAKMT